MVQFLLRASGEIDGRCKAFHYDRHAKTLLRCDDGTQRLVHPYCYNCWLSLNKVGKDAFPPVRNGRETRAAIGEKEIFYLTAPQMEAYKKLAQPSRDEPRAPLVSLRPRDEILVSTLAPNQAWEAGDQRHVEAGGSFAVYVVRVGDGSLYIGQTRKKPAHRFGEHQAGTGSQHLRERGIFGDRPVWSVQVSSRELALQLETCLLKAFRSLGLNVSIGGRDDEDERLGGYASKTI